MKALSFKPRLFSELKHYNKEKFAADAMSGLIVGIVALPLAIAFGIASGVSPEQGILTAIIGGFLVSLLGGSRAAANGTLLRGFRVDGTANITDNLAHARSLQSGAAPGRTYSVSS